MYICNQIVFSFLSKLVSQISFYIFVKVSPLEITKCHEWFLLFCMSNPRKSFDCQSNRKKGNNFNKQLDGNYLQQLTGLVRLDFCREGRLAKQLLEIYM